MKAINKEINNEGNIVLTCQKSYLFGLIKKEIKFIAVREICDGYYDWLKLPNKTLVNDITSFELDRLVKIFD